MPSAFEILNRRTTIQPKNPMDVATIVSVYPKELTQEYVTVYPPKYVIPAGSVQHPGLLAVEGASTWQDVDPERALIEIPIASTVMAEAIIRDFSNGLLGVGAGEGPGLFFVLGRKTAPEILKEYKSKLEESDAKQRNWYNRLLRMGDSLWARSNGNPLAISDDMRDAARELRLMDKDWLKDFQAVEKVRCKACGSFKDPQYPICAFCKYGDVEAVKKLGLVAVE